MASGGGYGYQAAVQHAEEDGAGGHGAGGVEALEHEGGGGAARGGTADADAAWWLRQARALLALALGVLLGYVLLRPPSYAPPAAGPAVVASPLDPRAFRTLRLGNNLQVALISDPAAVKAAAAMSVGSGNFMEGPTRGLAHFCEHMLFLGTARFPVEDQYFKFVSAHGGSANAYTAMEETNFYFDVDTRFLAPTLARFADFFVTPLLAAGSAAKEMHAVDSEFRKDVLQDGWREYQLLKQTASPAHPWHRFSIGNLGTLNTSSIVPDLRRYFRDNYSANRMRAVLVGRESLDELQALAAEHFNPIVDKALPLGYTPPPFVGAPYPPSRRGQRLWFRPVKDANSLSLYWPLPPFHRTHARSRAEAYVSSLLGDEEAGSALAVLKARGWAQALSAGLTTKLHSFEVMSVSVTLTAKGVARADDVVATVFAYVDLVRLEHRAADVGSFRPGGGGGNAAAAAEGRTDGVSKARFAEFVDEQRVSFRFPAMPSDVGDYASALASGMHVSGANTSGLADLLGAPSLAAYDGSVVRRVLDELTPANALIIGSSKQYARKGGKPGSGGGGAGGVASALGSPPLDRKEPWFGTRFHQAPITPEALQRWSRSPPDAAVAKGLKLPPHNRFIPKNLQLLPTVHDGPPAAALAVAAAASAPVSAAPQLAPLDGPAPELLLNSTARGLEVWWKQGEARFKQPKTELMCLLVTAGSYASARAVALTQVWLKAVADALDEPLYAARKVGFSAALSLATGAPQAGLRLTLSGWSDRMNAFAGDASKGIKQTASDGGWLDATRFGRILEKTTQMYRNFETEQPYQDAMYYHRLFAQNEHYTVQQVLAELRGQEADRGAITLPELRKHAAALLSRVALRCVVHGNVLRRGALSLAQSTARMLRDAPLPRPPLVALRAAAPPGQVPLRLHRAPGGWRLRYALALPRGSRLVARAPAMNARDVNSAVLVSYPVGSVQDDAASAYLLLLEQMAAQPAFLQLRTKEQLGYIVFLYRHVSLGVQWLNVIVQGAAHDPAYLQRRVERFVRGYGAELAAMTTGAFNAAVKVAASKLRQKDASLGKATDRLFAEVNAGLYGWLRRERRAAAMEKGATLAGLCDFFARVTKTQMSVQVVGKRSKKLVAEGKKLGAVPAGEQRLPMAEGARLKWRRGLDAVAV